MTGNATGLRVTDGGDAAIVRNNHFVGNAAGVVVSGSGNVDLRANWWGDASGPSGSGAGSGDSIAGTTLTAPWLGQPPTASPAWNLASAGPSVFAPLVGQFDFDFDATEALNWTVTVRDGNGTTVRSITGSDAQTTVFWDGSDTAGQPVADSDYTMTVSGMSTSSGVPIASAVAPIVVDAAAPTARITAPTEGSTLTGLTANVVGVADGTNFTSYVVEYGEGIAPTTWTPITSSVVAGSGDLAMWDLSTLAAGTWTLRLRVDANGVIATDTVVVRRLAMPMPSASLDVISPNGDGTADVTFLSAVVAAGEIAWTFTVRDEANNVVRTMPGSTYPPSATWDGTDAFGAVVVDGSYAFDFSVTDITSGVTLTSAPAPVCVDTTPPVLAITNPQDGTLLTVGDVVGTVDDMHLDRYRLLLGTGSSPSTFTFFHAGTESVVAGTLGVIDAVNLTPGTYTLRVTAEDTVGNLSFLDTEFTVDFFAITNVSRDVGVLDPATGGTTTISFTVPFLVDVAEVFVHDVESRVRVRTITTGTLGGGANSLVWDGKDDSGLAVSDGAYFFVVRAQSGPAAGWWNSADVPMTGPSPTWIQSNVMLVDPFIDAYENDLARIQYELSGPGSVAIEIRGPTPGVRVRRLVSGAVGPGVHMRTWDGRADDGTIYSGAFSVHFSGPAALPEQVIVVESTRPDFDEFRAESYLIHPLYREVSTLTYTLTRPAEVTVTITDPNGSAVRTLATNQNQAAGAHTLEWDGLDDAGRFVDLEGDYSVHLAGADLMTDVVGTRTGVIVVYRP